MACNVRRYSSTLQVPDFFAFSDIPPSAFTFVTTWKGWQYIMVLIRLTIVSVALLMPPVLDGWLLLLVFFLTDTFCGLRARPRRVLRPHAGAARVLVQMRHDPTGYKLLKDGELIHRALSTVARIQNKTDETLLEVSELFTISRALTSMRGFAHRQQRAFRVMGVVNSQQNIVLAHLVARLCLEAELLAEVQARYLTQRVQFHGDQLRQVR